MFKLGAFFVFIVIVAWCFMYLLGNDNQKQVAIGYLKGLSAVVIGVVIVLILISLGSA